MKVAYDSEADALSIDLRVAHQWDDGDSVDEEGQCNVAFAEGKVANVELLSPAKLLDLLRKAGSRFDLNIQALLAAAQAGLAAPDRDIVIYVGRRWPVGS